MTAVSVGVKTTILKDRPTFLDGSFDRRAPKAFGHWMGRRSRASHRLDVPRRVGSSSNDLAGVPCSHRQRLQRARSTTSSSRRVQAAGRFS